jgi:phosphate transport system substrate-binding protein
MKTKTDTRGLLTIKTMLAQGFLAVLLGLVVASCTPAKTDRITIRGSNTVGEELAPRLIAEFKKQRPGVEFDLEFKGTTYGFGALLVDRADIAAASRAASTNEMDLAKGRGIELQEQVIGAYSVAVVVNAGSPVANLSQEQVRDLFTGVVQNWKDVGGPDAPVHLYVRDPISGTYLGFQELAMQNKPYALGLKTCTNYQAIAQAVAGDPAGIGYVSFDQEVKPGVKPVAVGEIAPTAQTVGDGKYPYARTLRLYTNKGKETEATKAFLEFVASTPGQKIVAEMGYTPRR